MACAGVEPAPGQRHRGQPADISRGRPRLCQDRRVRRCDIWHRVREGGRPKTTIWTWFFGGGNDWAVPAKKLAAAVRATFAATRATAPKAKLLVIGPPWQCWSGQTPPLERLAVRDVLRDQAMAVGAVWVDPITEGWLADTPELIGSDGVHPTDAGASVPGRSDRASDQATVGLRRRRWPSPNCVPMPPSSSGGDVHPRPASRHLGEDADLCAAYKAWLERATSRTLAFSMERKPCYCDTAPAPE